jgi:ankyrin repeat protein
MPIFVDTCKLRTRYNQLSWYKKIGFWLSAPRLAWGLFGYKQTPSERRIKELMVQAKSSWFYKTEFELEMYNFFEKAFEIKMSFQSIYDLAVKADLPGLTALLKSGVCIDIRAPDGLNTAVSQLAKEGNTTAVDFLLANGANMDSAVKVYAEGGHFSKVNDLISRGGSVDVAVAGYITGEHLTQASWLRLVSLTTNERLKNALIYSIGVHSAVLSVCKDLGYTSEIKGLCHGFTIRWLEACLLDEIGIFDERIKKIVLSGNQLTGEIRKVKEKFGLYLTQHDRELIDILAFYDSLVLYHRPDELFSVFKVRPDQGSFDITSHFAASDKIIARNGLAIHYSETVSYTELEIKKYLDSLGQILEDLNDGSKEPIGMVLSSGDHAIAITYQAGKGWTFMDVNQYPARTYDIDSTHLIAEKISCAFAFEMHKQATTFNISLFTTGDDVRRSSLKKQLALFKQSHLLSKDLGREETIALVWSAAASGDVDVIVQLVRNGANLNSIGKDYTPAYMAAQNGHATVIVELGNAGADFNLSTKDGVTPTCIAARNGYASVIALLGKYGADPNRANNNGATPVFAAAQNGHLSAITELGKLGADVNLARKDGITPVWIAAQNGHADCVAELGKYGADLNRADDYGRTPALLATKNGHTNVIAELIRYGVNFKRYYILSAYQIKTLVNAPSERVIANMNVFIEHRVSAGNSADAIPMTCYDIACILGHVDIIQLLKDSHEKSSSIAAEVEAQTPSTTAKEIKTSNCCSR